MTGLQNKNSNVGMYMAPGCKKSIKSDFEARNKNKSCVKCPPFLPPPPI